MSNSLHCFGAFVLTLKYVDFFDIICYFFYILLCLRCFCNFKFFLQKYVTNNDIHKIKGAGGGETFLHFQGTNAVLWIQATFIDRF